MKKEINDASEYTHLPININPIKTQILDKINSRSSKCRTARLRAQRTSEIGRISPSTNRQQNLQIPITLLQQEQLLDAAVDIVPLVIPRVGGIVLVGIGPGIREIDLAGRAHVGECVQDVSQALCGEILWVVVPSIDGLKITCK